MSPSRVTAAEQPEQPPTDEVREIVEELFASGRSAAEIWQALVDEGVADATATAVVGEVSAEIERARVAAERFPFHIHDVRDAQLIPESFGWWPTIVAIWTIPAAYAIFQDGKVIPLGVLAVMAGVGLASYEVWRRRNRTVLAVRGFKVGIYRKRLLAQTIDFEQVQRYELDFGNTLYLLMMPAILTLVSIAQLFGTLPTSSLVGHPLAGLVLGGLCTWWVAKARLFGQHFVIPKLGASDGTEMVYLREDDVNKLLSRASGRGFR